jgi:hypothetical protein
MVVQAIVGFLFVASGVVLVASPDGLALRMLHHVRLAKITGPLYARMPARLLRACGVLFIAVGIGEVTFTFLR